MSLSTALLILLVLVAALACPAMMWFQERRGKRAPCCPPRGNEDAERPQDLDALKAEHARLSAELAYLESRSGDAATPGVPSQPRAS